jgi:hypothetical protein
MKQALPLLLGLFSLPMARAAPDTEILLRLEGLPLIYEKIGNSTSVRCADSDESENCRRLEELGIQPQVDWERLKKPSPASATFVDEFGGPWIFSVWKESTTVSADFPGYRLELANHKIVHALVLRRSRDWEQACQELGVDPQTGQKAKRGLKGLFR